MFILEIKDEAYVINFDEYKSIGTNWKAIDANGNNVTYSDRFGVEYIPKEVKKFIGNKKITANIYQIQAYNSKMCEYFCNGFIDFIVKAKRLLYQFILP